MSKIISKKPVKSEGLLLTFFVLFSLLISENGSAHQCWSKDYMNIEWVANSGSVLFTALAYNYSFGPEHAQAYLKRCKIEVSDNNSNYWKLMDIHTKQQKKSNNTTVYFNTKLKDAPIEFLSVVGQSGNIMWVEGADMKIRVRNIAELATVSFIWHMREPFENFYYIRVSVAWFVEGRAPNICFNIVTYYLHKSGWSKLKSNSTDINTKESKINSVKVFNESEAIVIKGTEPGANIKVYNQLGVVVKSVISVNDVVKIKLPAKQIYSVHVGNSQYKVGL